MFFVGLAALFLGGLWLLQGLGWIHVRPILCFTNCEPIEGASVAWATAGAFLMAGGGVALFYGLAA